MNNEDKSFKKGHYDKRNEKTSTYEYNNNDDNSNQVLNKSTRNEWKQPMNDTQEPNNQSSIWFQNKNFHESLTNRTEYQLDMQKLQNNSGFGYERKKTMNDTQEPDNRNSIRYQSQKNFLDSVANRTEYTAGMQKLQINSDFDTNGSSYAAAAIVKPNDMQPASYENMNYAQEHYIQNSRHQNQEKFLEYNTNRTEGKDNYAQKFHSNFTPNDIDYSAAVATEANIKPTETKEANESNYPIPLPQNSVKKHQSENTTVTNEQTNGTNKGSKQKKKGKKGKELNTSSVYLCVTCEKAICPNIHHNDHRIVPFEEGIQELENKEISKLKTIMKETDDHLKSEMQVGDMIKLWKSGIDESLQNVFKLIEDSNSQNTDRLLKVTEEGNKIIISTQQARISNLIQFVDLKTSSTAVISEGQQLSLQNDKPLWLIFSWFKISLAFLIQSGKQIFAFSKTKSGSQFAPFELQGDRLLLYSPQRKLTPSKDTLVVPSESVNSLFECDDFYAFMKISYNNKPEGCLFMRLDKETFWGNQFMALCSGEFGPSLRNSRFFRSCWKGKPGHHVWGGDYSRNDGSGGQSFFRWNKPFLYRHQPITKGLIASRPGVKDFGTIFRIYLSGADPKQKRSNDVDLIDKFSFGHVIDGLEHLAHVSDLPDISKSKIENAGRFLVLT